MTAPIITEPGAYPNISAEDYHGNINLLPAPSLSSSGAKKIISHSPYHFWFDSPLNTGRAVASKEKPHFVLGRLAHDLVLTPEEVAKNYHFLPEGFRSNATKQFATEIELAEHAIANGRTIVPHKIAVQAQEVAFAIQSSSDALNALALGEPELTLAWKDEAAGVWLRARPDWLPIAAKNGADIVFITDLKFMNERNCSPDGFGKALASFGYHQSCAFYEDGIKNIFPGVEQIVWLFVVIQVTSPFTVSVYRLADEDVLRGRHQNRIAINRFAECLNSGIWPDYTSEEILTVGLPGWARKAIDEHGSVNQAALVNAGE